MQCRDRGVAVEERDIIARIQPRQHLGEIALVDGDALTHTRLRDVLAGEPHVLGIALDGVDPGLRRAVAVGVRTAAVLGAVPQCRFANVDERIGRRPRHQRTPWETRTSILPKFSPRNSPISARGAFSMPSTTSSRYLMRPSRSQADTSRRKSF